MAGVNKVMLIGRLGADPERVEINGQSKTNFRIATSESWKDQNGQKQEKTEWHSCVSWGRTAELCADYLHKGSQVFVEGSLQTRKFTPKDGSGERYVTEIKVNSVQFLDSKNSGGNSGGYQESAPATQYNGGGSESTMDDMPF